MILIAHIAALSEDIPFTSRADGREAIVDYTI